MCKYRKNINKNVLELAKHRQKWRKNEKIPTKKSKNRKNIDYNFEKPRRDSKNKQKCQKNDKYVKKLSKNRKNV